MDCLLAAAAEINDLWRKCISENVQPEDCPTNEEIAEIIERHLNESNTKDHPHE